MSEIDLIQAHMGSVTLAYTASQWWIATSTALVVATYFAAKHIPRWLFGMIIILYLMSSIAAIWEVTAYSGMANYYYARLVALRAEKHVAQIGLTNLGPLNSYAVYAVLLFGTLCATAYSFTTWRRERHA